MNATIASTPNVPSVAFATRWYSRSPMPMMRCSRVRAAHRAMIHTMPITRPSAPYERS